MVSRALVVFALGCSLVNVHKQQRQMEILISDIPQYRTHSTSMHMVFDGQHLLLCYRQLNNALHVWISGKTDLKER